MFKIITKKEYNRLVSNVGDNSNIINNLKHDIKIKKSIIDHQNDVLIDNSKCIEYLKSNVNKLESVIVQLRKQLLILTPNRDAETGRFIPKYNSKKNEKKQV